MARKPKETGGRGDRARDAAADLQREIMIPLRGRTLSEAVETMPYDCLCIAHFDANDRCVGFTAPPATRPWFQRVGFCLSEDEMQARYEQTESWSSKVTLSTQSAAEAVAERLREGRPLDPLNVEWLFASKDWPEGLSAYIASALAAPYNEARQPKEKVGHPRDGKPDEPAGYTGGLFDFAPWLIPRFRHVWRAEALFLVRRRGLSAGAACEKVGSWHNASGGYIANSVGSLFSQKSANCRE